MVEKIVTACQKFWYRRSLKKAIKHAMHIKRTTGHKCLVLLFPGGYRAIRKVALKQVHRQGLFKKGVTVQQIEMMAVYNTN
jgi:hypothetical protein